MTRLPDISSNEHLHIADAVGFRVPPALLPKLGITGDGPFVGRAVRCSAGLDGHDYVAIADSNCGGKNIDVPVFEAAVTAAILAHIS